jgi:hypothetical protein
MSRASDATAHHQESTHDVFAEFLGVIAERVANAIRHDGLIEVPDAGKRSWRKVASTSTYDAWVAAWGAGSGIPEHDHGGSTAAFLVTRGSLVERTRAQTRIISAGAAATLLPHARHEVRNVGTTPAFSVHVYSPPLGDSWEVAD